MEIIPHVSIGELRFGESRQNIRHSLGNKYRPFQKGVGSNDTDAYDDLGLHLYFDDDDRLEFVEGWGPASPAFQGISFMGRQVEDVASDLAAGGYRSVLDGYGLTCESAGIALTAPTGIVEGVAAFRKGYYDE